MTRTKPLIGMAYGDVAIRDEQMKIRTYCTRKYYQALQKAGAAVILLPPCPETELGRYLDLVDGILLPGGEDVHPRFQGEDPIPALGLVNPFRDEFELALAREAFSRGVPTLGICRGAQVVAIAMGGSVHQDIVGISRIQHTQAAPRWSPSHKVSVKSGSILREWLGTAELFTNSFHHQAVNRVPKGFRVVATTSDGSIEAIESKGGKVCIGVQWHPEETVNSDTFSLKLFGGFLASALHPR